MNIKETILKTLQSDIRNIQIANGYTSDIKEVFIGTKDIQNINSYPVCTISEGNSKVIRNYNAKGDELVELDLLIRLYISEDDNSNTINSINLKADFKKLIYGDDNILNLYHSTLQSIPEIKKIQVAEETGILDYNSKIDYTISLLKIEYLQSANNIDGSSYIPVFPNILSGYTTTGMFTSAILSLTGFTGTVTAGHTLTIRNGLIINVS